MITIYGIMAMIYVADLNTFEAQNTDVDSAVSQDKGKKWLLFCAQESGHETLIFEWKCSQIFSNIFSLTAGPIEASVWHLSIKQQDLKQDVCYKGPDTEYPCFCPDGLFCCQYDTCVELHCCPYNFVCAKEGNSDHYNSCTNGKRI